MCRKTDRRKEYRAYRIAHREQVAQSERKSIAKRRADHIRHAAHLALRRAYMKQRRLTSAHDKERERVRRYRAVLSDVYIAGLLRMKTAEIPHELLDAKREIIRIKRYLLGVAV